MRKIVLLLHVNFFLFNTFPCARKVGILWDVMVKNGVASNGRVEWLSAQVFDSESAQNMNLKFGVCLQLPGLSFKIKARQREEQLLGTALSGFTSLHWCVSELVIVPL